MAVPIRDLLTQRMASTFQSCIAESNKKNSSFHFHPILGPVPLPRRNFMRAESQNRYKNPKCHALGPGNDRNRHFFHRFDQNLAGGPRSGGRNSSVAAAKSRGFKNFVYFRTLLPAPIKFQSRFAGRYDSQKGQVRINSEYCRNLSLQAFVLWLAPFKFVS